MNRWKNKDEFKARVHEWAEKLDIEIKTVSIRQMTNKWASYTKRNDLLIFNSALLDIEKDLGDYVIVHELLHFKVPNHGKLWKSLMTLHLGDYSKLEDRLKALASETVID
jgi:predicted metal-dependent hydrolase